ncbi:MAG: DUF362 domain-containing protein [Fimbriiglobus sp.]
MTANELRQQLISLQTDEGGWGYLAGQRANLEPTCWAMLALGAEINSNADSLRRGLVYLARHVQPDGSYRLQHGRPQAVWTTSLVLMTKTVLNADAADRQKMAERLLKLEGRVIQADPEVAQMHDIDYQLLGWPWAEDTFSWVEPTSWAVTALRAAGQDHPRIDEGLRLILDRAFASGGVNYGNRSVLGKPTEPMPGPTATMLIAVQGLDDPRIDAAVGYLRMHSEKSVDLENLAWIKLAISLYPSDEATRTALPRLDQRIQESLAFELPLTDGLGGGPLRLALAAMALETESRHPFRLSSPAKLSSGPSLGSQKPTSRPEDFFTQTESKPLGERLKSKVFGFMMGGVSQLRRLPATSAVHIAKASSYDMDLLGILKTQFEHFRQHCPMAGKRVVLKPNLVEYHRDKVINTDPRFIDAVIQLFQAEGASEIIVAEGPGHYRNVRYLVNESGLGDVLRKHKIQFVDINHDEPVKTPNLGRTTGLEFLYLSKTILSADVFVSLPKLKTHHWAGATLALKNLFGTLPGICYGWPKNELHWRGIPNSIVDIACTHTPHLAIVDGIIGMEGDGPLNGTAKPMGALVMGVDLLAVDATCCRLMKLPVEQLPTFVLAHDKKLGQLHEDKIPQLGDSIASLAKSFEWPPRMEEILIRQPVKK